MNFYADDCEPLEFYNEEHVKARREHACCECPLPIRVGSVLNPLGHYQRVGDIYVRCTGKADGSLFFDKQHVACWTFARKLNLDYIGECAIPFGGVEDALQNPADWLPDDIGDAAVASLRDEWSHIKAAAEAK